MKNDYLQPSQALLKKWAGLNDAEARRGEGIFLAEGVKVVTELFHAAWPARALLVLPEKIKYWKTAIKEKPEAVPVYQLSSAQWHKISQDKEPEGIMALASLPPQSSWGEAIKKGSGNALLVHEINNPANLGALLRSAHWFGFTNIILSEKSVDYTNPKTIRAAMGGFFYLTISANVDLMGALPEIKKTSFVVGSAARQGIAPRSTGRRTALLLGSESHGLPEELLAAADEKWTIPGCGQAESLSLPQAAAVMMYEIAKT